MTSLSKKPTNLPLSLSTNASPMMPTFYNSAPCETKAPKKKKSFSPFDRLRNVFGKNQRVSESDEPSVFAPMIVTPTEEPSQKIGESKAKSASAENVFSSKADDDQKVKCTQTLSMPQYIQNHRASSNECLKPKEMKVSKLLKSTECLVTEPDFEVSVNPVPVETKHDEEKDRKEVPKEDFVVSRRQEEGDVPNDDNLCNEGPTNLVPKVDLNRVPRGQDNLDHRAALHRKDLKPKGRRPPTVYKQTNMQVDVPIGGSASKLEVFSKCSSVENLETPTGTVKEEAKPIENCLPNKPVLNQHLKRNKALLPEIAEIQKARRKTIANFEIPDAQKNAEVAKGSEPTSTGEPKIVPQKPKRNVSFKLAKKEEAVSAREPEPPKVDQKPRSGKTLSLHVTALEKNPVFRERVAEIDLAAGKSQVSQQNIGKETRAPEQSLPSKESSTNATPVEQTKVSPPTKAEKDTEKESMFGNKRPQSRFIAQGSAPFNLSKSSKPSANLDGEDQRNKASPENKSPEVKITSETVGESVPLNKPGKMPPLKKLDEKHLIAGQPDKISEPPFKKFLKPAPNAACETSNLDHPSSTKSPPVKFDASASLKPAEQTGTSEAFESARQKFGMKASKNLPQSKSGDEQNVDSKAKQALSQTGKFPAPNQVPKPQIEEKIVAPKLEPPTTTSTIPQNSIASHFTKKTENKPILQPKVIPPEPFKTSPGASETGKNGAGFVGTDGHGNVSKFSPAPKARMSIRESTPKKVDDSQVQTASRFSSLKTSKENPSTIPAKEVIANAPGKDKDEAVSKKDEKPATRAATGINSKTNPSKLSFNPDDWMSRRREKLENLS